MEASQVPPPIPLPFANNAGGSYITYPIPTPSQQGTTNGAASFYDGFPPDCFIPIGSGGAGPFGKDFNGLLKQITAGLQWEQAGGPTPYGSSFSTDIGGYPAGAFIASAATPGLFWVSSEDNNTNDPDTGGADWLAFAIPSITATGAYLNKFRNASCSVNQRSAILPITVGAGTTSYTLDGWIVGATGAGITVAQAGQITGAISPYSLQLTGGVGVTAANITQVIEYLDTIGWNGLTITFQAKIYNNTGSTFTPKLTVKTAGSPDTWSSSTVVVNAVSLQSCSDSSGVTTVSYTFTMPSSCANGVSVTLALGNALNGSSNVVATSDWDMRVSPGVLFPEIRPYFVELNQCRRFMYAIPASANFGVANLASTTQMFLTFFFPVDMRIPPTSINFSSLSNLQINYSGSNNTPTACTFHNAVTNGITIEITDSGHTYTINTAAQIAIAAGGGIYFYILGPELNGTAI